MHRAVISASRDGIVCGVTQRDLANPVQSSHAFPGPTLSGGRWSLFAMGDEVSLFENLDGWIRMRLPSTQSKRFTSHGGADHRRWANRSFDELGLVRLEHLARQQRFSPAWGGILGELDAVPHVRIQRGPLATTPRAYPLRGSPRPVAATCSKRIRAVGDPPTIPRGRALAWEGSCRV